MSDERLIIDLNDPDQCKRLGSALASIYDEPFGNYTGDVADLIAWYTAEHRVADYYWAWRQSTTDQDFAGYMGWTEREYKRFVHHGQPPEDWASRLPTEAPPASAPSEESP